MDISDITNSNPNYEQISKEIWESLQTSSGTINPRKAYAFLCKLADTCPDHNTATSGLLAFDKAVKQFTQVE